MQLNISYRNTDNLEKRVTIVKFKKKDLTNEIDFEHLRMTLSFLALSYSYETNYFYEEIFNDYVRAMNSKNWNDPENVETK